MKSVFVDVDTQLDFLYPSGALYVPGAEAIVPAIARLNRFAGENGIMLISTMDAHAEDDPEFRQWPHHCVAGSLGQRKPAATLLSATALIPSHKTSVPPGGAKQILLEKQTFDAFSNANLPALLESLDADRYVVYGVVTEICVRMAAFGLLTTGKRVEIAEDAVRSLDAAASAKMFVDFCAAGGSVVSLDQALRG